MLVATLLIACSSSVSRPWRVQVQKASKSSKKGDQVIGFLKWKIIEIASGKVLGAGEKKVLLKDVVVSKAGEGSQVRYKETIALSDHFALSRPVNPEPTSKDLLGFGLTLERDDVDTFSWEWFNIDSPTQATKLQEGGVLGIKIAKTPAGYDIVRTDFQSYIGMRAADANNNSMVDRWRAVISKGSSIAWPVLKDGQIISG